jgi:hypothetical protein
MSPKHRYSAAEAHRIGRRPGVDWKEAAFGVDQFRLGVPVEPERGLHDLLTDVTDDSARLDLMEQQAKRNHSTA